MGIQASRVCGSLHETMTENASCLRLLDGFVAHCLKACGLGDESELFWKLILALHLEESSIFQEELLDDGTSSSTALECHETEVTSETNCTVAFKNHCLT